MTSDNSGDTAVAPEEALRVAADGVRIKGLDEIADALDALAAYIESGGTPRAVKAGFVVEKGGKFLNKGTGEFTEDNVTLWSRQNHMRSHIGAQEWEYVTAGRRAGARILRAVVLTVADEGQPLEFLERSPARQARLRRERREWKVEE